MEKGSSQIYNILVAVNFASTSERDFFAGVLRFSHNRPDWRIRVLQSTETLTVAEIRRAERNGTDGIITCGIGTAKTQHALIRSNIPLVLVGHHETMLDQRQQPTTCVTIDNVAIGKAGAEYLSGLGNFAAFSYIPSRKPDFARMDRSREIGFKRYLRKHKKNFLPYVGMRATLGKWIRDAPKPLALLCATDECAVQALKFCETLGGLAPDKVAVLGIDNDELLCRTTNPELSSIAINPENEGFVAAEQMEKLLNSRQSAKPVRTTVAAVRIAPVELKIIERASTKAVSPARHLISQAEQFIVENAHKPIKVDDVVSHLQVSRRLIELRFRQFKGSSILEFINSIRLNAFAKKLTESNAPIRSISTSCGFRNASYLKTMFRKRFGMTPKEYRTSAKSLFKTRIPTG